MFELYLSVLVTLEVECSRIFHWLSANPYHFSQVADGFSSVSIGCPLTRFATVSCALFFSSCFHRHCMVFTVACRCPSISQGKKIGRGWDDVVGSNRFSHPLVSFEGE